MTDFRDKSQKAARASRATINLDEGLSACFGVEAIGYALLDAIEEGVKKDKKLERKRLNGFQR